MARRRRKKTGSTGPPSDKRQSPESTHESPKSTDESPESKHESSEETVRPATGQADATTIVREMPSLSRIISVVIFRPLHGWIDRSLGERPRVAARGTTGVVFALVLLPILLGLLVTETQFTAMVSRLNLQIVGSAVDNVIKMFVLHGRSQLHPLLALLGILGGVSSGGLPCSGRSGSWSGRWTSYFCNPC